MCASARNKGLCPHSEYHQLCWWYSRSTRPFSRFIMGKSSPESGFSNATSREEFCAQLPCIASQAVVACFLRNLFWKKERAAMYGSFFHIYHYMGEIHCASHLPRIKSRRNLARALPGSSNIPICPPSSNPDRFTDVYGSRCGKPS